MHLHLQDVVSEEPERFFISEIVREQIFTQYREEIPYSSTVSPSCQASFNRGYAPSSCKDLCVKHAVS